LATDYNTVNTAETFVPTPRRHTRRAEVEIQSLLTSIVDGGEWSTSRHGHFTARD